MSKIAANTFSGGLQLDLNVLSVSNSVLTDALNVSLVTMNGDEAVLQNDVGNAKINLSAGGVQLTEGFVPVGMKEYGGILYIFSVGWCDVDVYDSEGNKSTERQWCGEVGTFPSPAYDGVVEISDGVSFIDLNKTGQLVYDYKPLKVMTHPLYEKDAEKYKSHRADLRTPLFNWDLKHPIHIECQRSYDDSVNLIFNDNKNIPRIVNTGFAVKSNNSYEIIERTINLGTSIISGSDINDFDISTSLVKRIKTIPKITFNGVEDGGGLKVGSYVFYFKYADADGNETDIIQESGIVNCFKGANADPFSIDGGFRDMNSNKLVKFDIEGIDDFYDHIVVLYTRNSSDVDQSRVVEYCRINQRFDIDRGSKKASLVITGYEDVVNLSYQEINQRYTIINKAMTTAQAQNILFEANVSVAEERYLELSDLAQHFWPFVHAVNAKDKIGFIDGKTYKETSGLEPNMLFHKYPGEYYNVMNLYYNLGYWEEEYYRLGVVFIYNDGSLSSVYNTRGGSELLVNPESQELDSMFHKGVELIEDTYNPSVAVMANENRRGVVRFLDKSLSKDFTRTSSEKQLYSLGFYLWNDGTIESKLKELNIKGFFLVRQKRMPTILSQMYLMPHDTNSNLPIIYRRRNTSYVDDWNKLQPFHSLVFSWKNAPINLVGESLIWDSGRSGNTEFVYKVDKENTQYLQVPHNDSLDRLAANKMSNIEFEKYINYEGRLFYFPPVEIDEIYKYTVTKNMKDVKAIQFGNLFRSDSNGYDGYFSNAQLISYDAYKDGGEVDWSAFYSWANGQVVSVGGRNKSVFLALTSFYKSLYDPATSEFEKYENAYNQFINYRRQYTGVCPDFYVKQPYYNQFFTGGEFVIRLARQNTAHSFLEQDDFDKCRHYFMSNDLRYAGDEVMKYIKANIVSITDSMPIGATSNEKEGVFRAVAGNAQEAYRFKTYWKNVNDEQLSGQNQKNNIDHIYMTDYKGQNGESLAGINGVLNGNGPSNDPYNTVSFVRGLYSPYLGVKFAEDFWDKPEYAYQGVGRVYNVYIPGFEFGERAVANYMELRYNSAEAYYPISDRLNISDLYESPFEENEFFRGDCFFSTFTYRVNRNFQDPSAPTNDIIIDNTTWDLHGPGGHEENAAKGDYSNLNRGDVNAVALGSWVTVKCNTNYNLSIRSIDESHVSEKATMGHSRSFYPLSGFNIAGSNKIPESQTMNDGFNATVGERYYYAQRDVQYFKNNFSNRIYYSDISQSEDGSYKNGYRVIQTKHQADYNPEYGGITKLVEIGGHLLVVFEHAIGLCEINANQLMSDAQSGTTYLETRSVLPPRLHILTDSHGSQWAESVIKSPSMAIYGVDTTTKKIWRVAGNQFKIISDFVIESFLNNNIDVGQTTQDPYLGLRNVKSHYNAMKSEVMFTFVNNNRLMSVGHSIVEDDEEDRFFEDGVLFDPKNKDADGTSILEAFEKKSGQEKNYPYTIWNIAFSEIGGNFSTFYSWLPSYSENIDNMFFSFDWYNTRHQVLSETLENNRYSVRIPRSDIHEHDDEHYFIRWENEDEFTPYLWKHGVSGRINERYVSKPLNSHWYGSQHPMEFEFVVNENAYSDKIFDNLRIIGNNSVPESVHISITGDSYDFENDKKNMYFRQEATKELYSNLGSHIDFDRNYTELILHNRVALNPKSTVFPLYYLREPNNYTMFSNPNAMMNTTLSNKYRDYQHLSGSEITWDRKKNEFGIVTHMKISEIDKESRLRGNIQYLENCWKLQLPSITFMQKNESWTSKPPIVIGGLPTDILNLDVTAEVLPNTFNLGEIDLDKWSFRKESRIRDKYCKIRLRYSGEKLTLVQGVQTIYKESQA